MNETTKKDKYFYFSKVPSLTTREVALAMLGFDHNTENGALNTTQRYEFNRMKEAITRNIQQIQPANKTITAADREPSHHVLCAAYIYQDENTPKQVKEAINKAVIKMTNEKGWEKSLRDMGGDELYELGKKIRHHKRGLHKRDDEKRNDWKLIALLVELLQEHGKPKYKDKLNIYRDIEKLCHDKGISTDGIKKSTFFSKIKDAINLMEFEIKE
ncbi:hypothetical protein ABG797_000386 [Salmonella enterica]